MLSSTNFPPFTVFHGTKLKDDINNNKKKVYNIQNWNKREGCTSHIKFWKQHSFDTDITIRYPDFLLDEVYPNKRMGLLMYMAPSHHGGIVGDYIKQITDKGCIVVLLIEGGFKFTLQVRDISANKQLKALIKYGYLKWHRKYIAEGRKRLENNGHRSN